MAGFNAIPGLTFDNGGAAPAGLTSSSFGPAQPVNITPQQFQSGGGLTQNPSSPTPSFPKSTQSVLGLTTTAPSGGGGDSQFTQYQKMAASGGLNPVQQSQYNQMQQQSDPYASIKQGISSAWDSYLGSLGGIQSDLGNQQTAQQKIADTQLQAGQNAINTQKANSLRDIANTTRNAFQAGNNYLGSMGAGDSSAANQYSFAINQQANKQTGDLNNFVNTQMNNLQSTHDNQINQIANWFSQQQQALKQQIAQGGLQKGQDLSSLSTNILNQAIAATQAIKQNTQNQYNALVQWAANNSQNVGQLQQNIAQIPQAMGQIGLFGGNQQQAAPYYSGAPVANTKQTDIFGNPIQTNT